MSLLIRRDATLRTSGAPAGGISQSSTCICLPARSRFGEGRALFEQPGKDDFFSSLLESKEPRPQGGTLTPKFLNPKKRSRNKFGMTKRPEPNRNVMLNLFQHLVFFYLQQMHLSSPSLPTGRQAQDGFRNRKIMTGGYVR
jgi:hypothetical protein